MTVEKSPDRGLPPLTVSSTDDPRVVDEAAREDYTLHVTPRSWRMGRLSLASAWWAVASAMFWLILGALVALAVGTVDAIIGMVLAAAAYGGINAVFSRYAARTGLTSNLFSRALFGSRGSILAPILVAATAVYFACFEGSVIAIALEAYFGVLPLPLWYLVVVLYSVPLIFGPLRLFLDKFNGALFPFYVLGLAGAVGWTIAEFGYDGAWLTQRPETVAVSGPGWWWAFTVYLADFVLMMATWDYARLGRPTRRDERFHSWITFGPVFYLVTIVVNGVAGIFVALTIPTEGELTEVSGVLGIVGLMGLSGVAFVWVSQTRINTTNFYLSVINLESFQSRITRVRLSRITWGVVVGGIVYLIMLSNVFDYILVALRYQAVLAVTWTACALAFISTARWTGADPARAEWRPGRVPRYNRVGLAAWAAGTFTGFALLAFGDQTSWTGTWALPLAFGVSAAVQVAGSLVDRQRGRAVLHRPHDPRDEVEDMWETRIRCHVCDRSYVAVEMDRDPSAGHAAICADHAQADAAFAAAARAEAQRPVPGPRPG
ncbi:thiamine permease [Pseudonocardia sp. C8]|uniref:purine-cytosine permease family protein n=1 Tax=Pseudonocardia sp. C8 TaxID=2762759 RepID=UPI0016428CCA|nr:thiamine permease [Pseudonocardia sp. C8]MBC3193354.1 thiamine permease [Pseudonocardia sp. C8]